MKLIETYWSSMTTVCLASSFLGICKWHCIQPLFASNRKHARPGRLQIAFSSFSCLEYVLIPLPSARLGFANLKRMVPSTEAVLAVIRASRPELRSAHDRVAFALHATFSAAGYSLVATGAPAASAHQGSEEEEVGIEGWNEIDGGYAFRYTTAQKDFVKTVDVRCTVINDLLMVDAAPVERDGGSQPVHLEIKVADYAKDSATGNYAQQYKDLDGLVKLISSKLLDKFYKAQAAPAATRAEQGKRVVEEGPVTRFSPSYGVPFYTAPSVGRGDLMPSVGAGIFEPRRDGGFESGEGGSIVGPHHPMWGRVGNDPLRTDFPDGGIPIQPPPGARFDPFGPPGIPGFEPQRFGRGSGGTRPHPDLQHFPP